MSHRSSRRYYVYIMTNRSYTSLYTGVTNELSRRVWQHKHQPSGFAKRYGTGILVYCQETPDVWQAIEWRSGSRTCIGAEDRAYRVAESVLA